MSKSARDFIKTTRTSLAIFALGVTSVYLTTFTLRQEFMHVGVVLAWMTIAFTAIDTCGLMGIKYISEYERNKRDLLDEISDAFDDNANWWKHASEEEDETQTEIANFDLVKKRIHVVELIKKKTRLAKVSILIKLLAYTPFALVGMIWLPCVGGVANIIWTASLLVAHEEMTKSGE